MQIARLFFSLNGRIGRRDWWIGTIVVSAVQMALDWMLGAPIFDESAPLHLRSVAFFVELLGLYPNAAIAVKRLHDRDRSGNYVWPLLATDMSGMLGDLWGFAPDPQISSTEIIIFVLFSVIVVAYLIELGVRRGSSGSNQFGPEPA